MLTSIAIILTRAGLSLNLADLKKVGRPAIMMCFVPACVEMIGTIIFAPILLGISILDAAIIGSVIAAVSPAVVVPRMIRLIENGYGTDKSIPQLILAGASVDDVFVIVVFTALTTLASTGEMSVNSFLQIPISIVLGIILGCIVGIILVKFFKKFHMRDSVKVLVILSVSFLLLELQTQLEAIVPVSALLAIMSMGIMMNQTYDVLAKRLSVKYNKLWLGAEIFLFVLVGIAVDLKYAVAAAYTPKATVQAAIGTIPLSMGLACGELVLTVAVISILITAPFGAICIDNLYKKLLSR